MQWRHASAFMGINPEGKRQQLVEFVRTEGYEEQSFMQKVTFLFLPGSNFDFGWFRFTK
jgi:beta-galactosidase